MDFDKGSWDVSCLGNICPLASDGTSKRNLCGFVSGIVRRDEKFRIFISLNTRTLIFYPCMSCTHFHQVVAKRLKLSLMMMPGVMEMTQKAKQFGHPVSGRHQHKSMLGQSQHQK